MKSEQSEERLDSLSKILIATGQINYLANCINSVNEQMKRIPDNRFLTDGIIQKDEILENTVKKLAEVMEDLGNLINAHDCITGIDVLISKVPFDIIVHGKDQVDL